MRMSARRCCQRERSGAWLLLSIWLCVFVFVVGMQRSFLCGLSNPVIFSCKLASVHLDPCALFSVDESIGMVHGGCVAA